MYALPTTHVNPKSFSEANLVDDCAVVLKADAVVVHGKFPGSNCWWVCLFSLLVFLTELSYRGENWIVIMSENSYKNPDMIKFLAVLHVKKGSWKNVTC